MTKRRKFYYAEAKKDNKTRAVVVATTAKNPRQVLSKASNKQGAKLISLRRINRDKAFMWGQKDGIKGATGTGVTRVIPLKKRKKF